MDETVEILENALSTKEFKSAAEVMTYTLLQSNEMLDFDELCELYIAAGKQIANGCAVKYF